MSELNAYPSAGDSHDHPPHEQHHEHDGPASHSTFKGYMIGFILSIILTVIPFWLVMDDVITSAGTTTLVILLFALVQVIVHMIYFLHMNSKSEAGWNMLALIFTLILVFITFVGSIWVMYHLNINMMPGIMSDAVHNAQ